MPKISWLPEPAADLPDGLLLFDGYCHICSGSVRFAIVRDKTHQFSYVPCQSPWGYELMARFGIDRDIPETFGFVDKGRMLFKSDAAIASAARHALVGMGESFRAPAARLARYALRLYRPQPLSLVWQARRLHGAAEGATARFLTERPA